MKIFVTSLREAFAGQLRQADLPVQSFNVAVVPLVGLTLYVRNRKSLMAFDPWLSAQQETERQRMTSTTCSELAPLVS